MQRAVGLGLHQIEQTFADQLEDGHESDGHAHPPLLGAEETVELRERLAVECGQDIGHARTHRQPLALNMMVREHLRTRDDLAERDDHLLQRDLRQARDRPVQLARRVGDPSVALEARQLVDAERSLFVAFVLLEAPHQLRARVGLLGRRVRRTRQQHARFEFRQRRRHDQILAGQLQLHLLHHPDVVHVLPRDVGKRDVEDVEVLSPDEIEQQVERALESLEEHLERLRRDVEVARQLRERLALHHRERHLALQRQAALYRKRRALGHCGVLAALRHDAQVRSGHRFSLPAGASRAALHRVSRGRPRGPFRRPR